MRQILDLRTQAQRQGISRTQQTAQAIADILKTVGAAEQKRRERQTLDRITRAISEGATTVEAIAKVAGQEPQFGTGIPGALQRFGGAFQPGGGNIEQAIIGQVLQQALARPTMSDFRMQKYRETGDETWVQPGLIVRSPYEATGLTGLDEEDYKKRLREKKTEEQPLSFLDVGRAGKAMDAFIDDAAKTEIGPNYTKTNLLKAWDDFKIQSGYSSMSSKRKGQLWNEWKNKIARKNADTNKIRQKLGLGKGEFEFDPNDPDWIVASELGDELGEVTGKRVKVVSPDGQEGDIPAEQLQDALKQGYKLVE